MRTYFWKSDDIAAFTYQADVWCPGCTAVALGSPGEDSESAAFAYISEQARIRGVDTDDLHSYDSDDFPKPVFVDQLSNDESCAGCGGNIL